MIRLTVQTERCWSGIEEEELEAIRGRETVPEAARSIVVCLDGVMVSMLEELEGDVRRPAGWREASTGAVLLLNGDGDVLSSRYFGRLPEQGKRSLKRLLTAEVMHLRKRRPDLRLIAAADAAPDSLDPCPTPDQLARIRTGLAIVFRSGGAIRPHRPTDRSQPQTLAAA